jgi:hypothetical protein
MELSKAQKEIIKDIADKKVKDLNSFYLKYLENLKEEGIGYDILGYTPDKPILPKFCSVGNTVGIILEDLEMKFVIDYISLWKKLEKIGLIVTSETNISPYVKKKLCFIPLLPEEKRTNGKYNNDAFNLITEYLNKVIISSEALNVFVKKGYMTSEERNINFKRKATWISIIIALIGIISTIFSIIYNSNK